jgi:hypothetical protein
MKKSTARNLLALGLILLSGSQGFAQSLAHPRAANTVNRSAVTTSQAMGASNSATATGGISQTVANAPFATNPQAPTSASHQANGGMQSASASGAKVCRTEGATVYYCN